MVKTLPSNPGGCRLEYLVRELGSHRSQGQNTKHESQEQYCNKFNRKTLKMVHIKYIHIYLYINIYIIYIFKNQLCWRKKKTTVLRVMWF